MKNEEVKKCKNCGFENAGVFCQNCGQKLQLVKINFFFVLRDFFGTVFNLDAPFPKTMVQLIVNPGALIRDFLDGSRKQYYAPIRYLILCLFINLLVGGLLGFDPVENQKAMGGETTNGGEGERVGYLIGDFLVQYLNYFLLIFPFVIGFISKLFFWRIPYNYAERVVFGFFIGGQYIIISLLPIGLSLIHPSLFLLHYAFSILYLTYATYSFHNMGHALARLLKSFLMGLMYLVVYFVVAIIFASVILKAQGKI